MNFLTPFIFLITSCFLVLVFNRFFKPVTWRVAGTLALLVCLYLLVPLFTTAVEFPGGLSYKSFPWRSLPHGEIRDTNTGIVFTQLGSWTELARGAVRAGEMPLWNHTMGAGSPLLANQQTSIFHPFTLLGLPLPLGEAWTLSVALRLFALAFFSFVLFREWGGSSLAAMFGSVAFSYCVFHVVWLLFPLGLSSMALPMILVGVHELVLIPRRASFALLVIGFVLSILGGHPESALWVSTAAGLYAVFLSAGIEGWSSKVGRLAITAGAALVAAGLSAPVWLPTLEILPLTPRYQAQSSLVADPVDHGITAEWLAPLVVPNILGRPQDGTYAPPEGAPVSVPHDYGEIATGYAGVLTFGFAIAGLFSGRARVRYFALLLMVFAFLTIYEVPGWMHLLRRVPLLGVSLTQRLRLFWSLGCAGLAVVALGDWVRGRLEERILRRGVWAAAGWLSLVSLFHLKTWLNTGGWRHQAPSVIFSLAVIALAMIALKFLGSEKATIVFMLLTFLELTTLTRGYNRPSMRHDVYPLTPAIEFLQRAEPGDRMVALGWSFLPNTPGAYGIEDVKTTDPLKHGNYMRLFLGYFHVGQNDYNQQPQDLHEPFVDYLSVRYVYAPPDHDSSELVSQGFRLEYEGSDGNVFENTEALPRYFLANQVVIEPDFDMTVARLKHVSEFRSTTIVDHIPDLVIEAAEKTSLLDLRDNGEWHAKGGTVELVEYGPNERRLRIKSNSWNLLVTSDTFWPGWRTYWNGSRMPPVVVNGAFVGTFVPPGVGELRLRYAPKSLDIGLRIASWTLILLILLLLGERLRSLWTGRHLRPSRPDVTTKEARGELS